MNEQLIDRKTAAFYLTLLAVIILDLIVIVWMLSPLTHLGTSAYASQRMPAVSDATKPSPFDFAEAKYQTVQGSRHKRTVAPQ